MDFSINIINYPDGENQQSSYEKKFNPDTTVKQVLEDFGLQSALIVGVDKYIINPENTLNSTYEQLGFQNMNKYICLKMMPQQIHFPDYTKFKYYQKEQNKIIIRWDAWDKNQTLYSYSHFQGKEKLLIHKNRYIYDQLSFSDLQKNNNDLIEFSILNRCMNEDEILVIIYSDKFMDQVDNYINNKIQQSHDQQFLSQYEEELVIKEEILYYEIQKKSDTIEQILDKLKNQKIFALQSSQGILESKKTLGDYFKTELQCKLLLIKNKFEVQNQQIENKKIMVNVYQSGQQILRRLFDKLDKIVQVEKRLPQEIQGQVIFIMPGKEIINYNDDLGDLGENEIHLEIIIKYEEYDRMENILKQALKQVQELKQKSKEIEIKQESKNTMYQRVIQKDQTINRLLQIVEEQRYKEDQKQVILKIQNIIDATSVEII